MSDSITTIREKNQASYCNTQMGQQTKRDIPIQKHPMSNPNTQMFSQNTGSWLYHQPAIISRKPK
jgi:hypothetical protein